MELFFLGIIFAGGVGVACGMNWVVLFVLLRAMGSQDGAE